MLCPVCQETLLMTERQGVEIDYCPKCRGVWLDRGELEKLIERSAGPAEVPPNRGDRRESDYEDDDEHERIKETYARGKYKKRESWFSRIFDFD